MPRTAGFVRKGCTDVVNSHVGSFFTPVSNFAFYDLAGITTEINTHDDAVRLRLATILQTVVQVTQQQLSSNRKMMRDMCRLRHDTLERAHSLSTVDSQSASELSEKEWAEIAFAECWNLEIQCRRGDCAAAEKTPGGVSGTKHETSR